MKTTKKPKHKHDSDHPAPRRRRTHDDELPIGALVTLADWVLDLARRAADDDEPDTAKVERVRAFVHARAAGRWARSPSEHDLLTVVALAVAALEGRHGLHGLGEVVTEVVGVVCDGPAAAPCAPLRATPRLRAPRLTPHLYCVP